MKTNMSMNVEHTNAKFRSGKQNSVAINNLSWIVPTTERIHLDDWWLVDVEMENGCLKFLLICKKIYDDKFNDVLNSFKESFFLATW